LYSVGALNGLKRDLKKNEYEKAAQVKIGLLKSVLRER
jgi:hypothetical protein